MAFRSIREHPNQVNPVIVRDIIIHVPGRFNKAGEPAVQKASFGEYLENSNDRDLGYESGPALINRLVQQIMLIASAVRDIHLKDNFIQLDSETKFSLYSYKKTLSNKIEMFRMKSNNLNCITRATTQEFSFYPNKDRGPLTYTDYSNLIEQLEMVARRMPDNMHLILSSFPIVNEAHDLHCMTIYMQCGRRPIIDSFGKATPSRLDPIYQFHKLPNIAHGNQPEPFFYWLIDYRNDLFKSMEDEDLKSVGMCLYNIQSLFNYYPEYCQVESYKSLRLLLNELFESIRSSNEKILFSAYKIRFQTLLMPYIIYLSTNLHHMNEYISQMREVTGFKLHASDTQAIRYGAIQFFTTLGGHSGASIIDVCLEHQNKIAKLRLSGLLNQHHTQPLPVFASHIITSNSAQTVTESLTSEHLIHADCAFHEALRGDKKIACESILTINHTHFGMRHSISKCYVYKPQIVPTFETDLINAITLSNLNSQYSHLRSIRELHPYSNNKKLNQAIKRCELYLLAVMADDSILLKSLDWLVNNLTQFQLTINDLKQAMDYAIDADNEASQAVLLQTNRYPLVRFFSSSDQIHSAGFPAGVRDQYNDLAHSQSQCCLPRP